jgi:hypothetical protein
MFRTLLPLVPLALVLPACTPAPQPASVPLAAPTPAAAPPAPSQPIVLRRCDDGGDGGVLIDGICL